MQLFEQSAVTRIDYGPEVKVHTAEAESAPRHWYSVAMPISATSTRNSAVRCLPAGSYIIATEPLSEELAHALLPQNMAVCDQRVALDYYRLSADRRLLFGGACHYSGRDPKTSQPTCGRKCWRFFHAWVM